MYYKCITNDLHPSNCTLPLHFRSISVLCLSKSIFLSCFCSVFVILSVYCRYFEFLSLIYCVPNIISSCQGLDYYLILQKYLLFLFLCCFWCAAHALCWLSFALLWATSGNFTGEKRYKEKTGAKAGQRALSLCQLHLQCRVQRL